MNYSDAIVYLKENNITKEDGTFYEFGEVCNSWLLVTQVLTCIPLSPLFPSFFPFHSPSLPFYFLLSPSFLPLSSCQDIPEAPERAMTDKINEVRIFYSRISSTSSFSSLPSVPHSLAPLPLHPPSPSFSAVFLPRSNHSTWLAVPKTKE